ncbi:BON domain-containing protein [Sneathiella sp. P13V-1]|uniref:BON domain-containing protein n=1 Tax=Sneathiella sp. P13V-1 TaxID=2697366 RepID=UPI00187B385D|nr:BON domain-containing protein [Sneathiella sp. P13V-1]MBE7635787.1 BON domain-containing protein [Sneathiella sp. P13V-1]
MKFCGIFMLGILGLGVLSGCTPVGAALGGAAIAGVVVAEERSVSDAFEDGQIKVSIVDRLLKESQSLFVDVSTTVIEGRVLLTGEVQNANTRRLVAELIWKIDGVREVINELQISDKNTVVNATEDSWISAKLKTRVLQDTSIKHVNYSFDTVNRVVYIFGIGQDSDEIERVYLHARDISGVRKIISHAITKDSPKRKKQKT